MPFSLRSLAATLMVAATFAFSVPLTAQATETSIDVRVISRGAKFIGSSMGGMKIVIEDISTGKVLAEGLTEGSTGDTNQIMGRAHRRNGPVTTEGTGAFHAALDIEEPTRIKVTATGPMRLGPDAVSVSNEGWLLPGKDITKGDGWILELPGFAIMPVLPPVIASLSKDGGIAELAARITMMCGCPIIPGGLWDAKGFEMAATIYRDGKKIEVVKLGYAGVPSIFAVRYQAKRVGEYEAVIHAYDSELGNTGLLRLPFSITQ